MHRSFTVLSLCLCLVGTSARSFAWSGAASTSETATTAAAAAPFADSGWKSLGPTNIAGRTMAIVIDPTVPSTVYVASPGGGVWKSTNGGDTWHPTTDMMASLVVSSLVIDPARRQTLYAGTGEGYGSIWSRRGAGIYRTTDAGSSWSQLPATAGDPDFFVVNDLIVSHADRDRLYAATSTGVWRSRDRGATWTRELNPPDGDIGCTDLAIRDDLTADVVVASCGSFVQGRIYRNPNAGGAGTFNVRKAESGMGRASLAFAPSNQNIVYAAVATSTLATEAGALNGGGLHAILRSTDGGQTWGARHRNRQAPPLGTEKKKLNNMLFTDLVGAYRGDCDEGETNTFENSGWYANTIAVDPVDPNRVWVGGVEAFRSNNGGTTWGTTSYSWLAPSNTRFLHDGQHAFVFHPAYNGDGNTVLFAANDGGIFRTSNARASRGSVNERPCSPSNEPGQTVWTPRNSRYVVSEFNDGDVAGGSRMIGGTVSSGVVLGSLADGDDGWSTALRDRTGDAGDVAAHPRDRDVLYAELPAGALHKSVNGGASFSRRTSGISDNGFGYLAPLEMAPGHPSELWTGGFSIWRTTNGATGWEQASAVTPGNGHVSAIAVAPSDHSVVYAGLSDGFILRQSNALASGSGTTWPHEQPRVGVVSDIAVRRTDPRDAFATYASIEGNHVWKTTNGGASWSPIDGGGLPNAPVSTIVLDPDFAQRLYVGTDRGVYATLDGGATWHRENTGFANVATEALEIVRSGDAKWLYAFTHGRGAWRVQLSS